MKEFITFVVAGLVERPEEAVLHEESSDPAVLRYRIEVARPDVGRLIGRGGTTIAAIRGLLTAAASRQGKRAFVDVVERGGTD